MIPHASTEVQAKFVDGRVYFGTFDQNNDVIIDPEAQRKTQRSGLNFFRFNLIGSFLHLLGLAYKVHYFEGQKHGVVYLHPKSFDAWKEKHRSDFGLNTRYLDHGVESFDIYSVQTAVRNEEFEKAIQIICDNFAITGNIKVIKAESVLAQDKNPQIPAIAFGKEQWAELGVDVENIPLPQNIDEILKSPCPYSKGEKVEDTHVLVLRPKSINVDKFREFMKSKNRDLAILFWEKCGELFEKCTKLGKDTGWMTCGELRSNESYWMLMKKDIISESKNKDYPNQRMMVADRGKDYYEFPGALDVIVCVMAEYARSQAKIRSFSTNSNNPSDTCWATRCKDMIDGNQVIFGAGYPNGRAELTLSLQFYSTSGVAPLRKL